MSTLYSHLLPYSHLIVISLINETRINKDPCSIFIDSLTFGALHDRNDPSPLIQKIHKYYGNDTAKNIFNIDYVFIRIIHNNHWFVAVVIKPRLLLGDDHSESG